MKAKTACLAASLLALGGTMLASGALAQGAGLKLEVLSSAADMVTGGDALVKITGTPDKPVVKVGATDVSGAFKSDQRGGWVGLVTGLKDGDNPVTATAGGKDASLTLKNHPLNGTLFAGPQQTPFLCENEGLKLGAPKDANCAADTVVKYLYLAKSDNRWKEFDPKGARPTDLTETAVGSTRVPVMVRVETGVINRAGYTISMLHDPATPLPTPENPTANKAWNGKLIYAYGGGVQSAYHMGLTGGLNATGTGASIMGDNLIKLGYALASGTLNRFGGNSNDVTSAETTAKVKERFIEEFGPPVFTIGYGPSGGSMQQNLIGNNYPGLLDGTIPQRLYADTMTFQQPLYDCELLLSYFNKSDRRWTEAQKTAVSGLATIGYCATNGTRYPNARPDNCDAAVKDAIAFEAAFKANPPRCTYQDNMVNIFGKDPKTGFARNPFDNVGVQYGLKALNAGTITFDDFIDLNKKIGGMDVNGKVVAARQVGDPIALRAAYETGRVNQGGAGMNEIPVLDIRTWHELTSAPEGNVGNIDVHNAIHSKILRDRMVRANKNADNMVSVTVVEGANRGEGSAIQLVELKYLTYLDQWIAAIQADKRDIPKAQKVRANRPPEMANACFPTEWMRVTDPKQCEQLFPNAAHPRMVAGGPSTDDVFKCQLKPVEARDYKVRPNVVQMAALRETFPGGVCDYSKPGVGQVPLAGTWLTYPRPEPAPVAGSGRPNQVAVLPPRQ